MKLDRERAEKETAYREEMRLNCQTDILFLANMLGYTAFIERVHRPAADLFMKKNPALSIADQSNIKEYLHLDPRGTFKSTLSIVDMVQWIICFPEIRICVLTATKPLAAAIAGEVTDHFVKGGDEEVSDFHFLFPEFCITPKAKRVGEYTAPCRKRNWREATVMAFSIETTISGWHFDVLIPDDVVDTQNSSTPQGVEKVKRNYRINKKTLMPWGYKLFKGTRYNPFELWGDLIEKAKPGKIKILNRAAFVYKDNPKQRLEPGDFPKQEDIVLLFPELLSYEFLKNEFEDDYSSFMTQYMNDAHGDNEVIFTPESLLNASVTADELPVSGNYFVIWKLPHGDKAKAKYAGAAAGLMDGGRMYITDAERVRVKPSGLAHKIVQMAKKHGVHEVQIEDTPGARYYEAHIKNYALISNWPVSITWLEFEEDESARDLRMKAAEPLITTRRLILADSIKIWKDVKRQLVNFGLIEENELVDVISRLAAKLPQTILASQITEEQDLAWESAKQRDQFDRLHGLGQYSAPVPVEVEKPYEPQKNSYGLDEMMPGLNG